MKKITRYQIIAHFQNIYLFSQPVFSILFNRLLGEKSVTNEYVFNELSLCQASEYMKRDTIYKQKTCTYNMCLFLRTNAFFICSNKSTVMHRKRKSVKML